MRTLLLVSCTFMSFLLQAQQTLSEARYEGMNRAYSLSPQSYYEKFDDGFIVMRDGSKIEGKIEKLAQKIGITTKDGKKFKISLYAIHHYGLNLYIPQNYSPLLYYDWNGSSATKKPQRGFVKLKSGETLDGKIRLKGNRFSSEDFLAETVYFTDATGKETAYAKEQVKGYGRILPWVLTPYDAWQWSMAFESTDLIYSKPKLPGFVVLANGKRIEGEIQIFMIANNKNIESVDQISIKHDGVKEKISTDDVLAFGLSNMTINGITKKSSITYPLEEMNFHEGSLTTKDGKEMKGLIAYQPKPNAYYGVYFATGLDQPITIIPNDQLQLVDQNISAIEAFDDVVVTAAKAAAPKVNTNITGFIISLDGTNIEGTVTITEDNDWWVKGMDFVSKEGVAMSFGGTNPPISCFVTNSKVYIQYENIFVKGEVMAAPLTIYSDPFPPKIGGVGGDMLNFLSQDVSNAVGAEVSAAVLAQQMRYNTDIEGTITENGQDKKLGGLDAAYYIGESTSSRLNQGILKLTENKTVPVKGTRKDEYFIFDIRTAENTRVIYEAGSPEALNHMEVFLEGCLDYYSLTKDQQKALLDKKNYVGAIEYLNACYTKNSQTR
ncbi:hypothetical protein BH09BAC3_BH09BAC3_29520 [soil metagenome]